MDSQPSGQDENGSGCAAIGAENGLALSGRSSGGNLRRGEPGHDRGWHRFRTRTPGNENLRTNTRRRRLRRLVA